MYRHMVSPARSFLLAYIFFVSWAGAFALGPWLRVHYLVALCALVAVAANVGLRGRFYIAPYRHEDYWVLIFLFVFTFAAIVNPNTSSLNYIAAYVYVLIGLYLIMKGALYSFVGERQIYLANLVGIIFVGTFLSVNFILHVTGIMDLQGSIPRLRETTATYAGTLVRGYGFSTEPGMVAYYLNTLGPLALWYMWSQTNLHIIFRTLFTCLVIIGWAVTFSAGGVSMLLASLIISSIIIVIRNGKLILEYSSIKKGVILFIIIASIVFMQLSSIGRFFQPIYMKITLSNELGTVTDRIERLEAGYSVALSKPILGYGPGYFSSIGEGSTINWYLMIMSEGGSLALIVMLIFLATVFVRIIRFQHPSRFAILVGYVAACGHMMITTTSGYLHPFLWLLIAIFYAQLARHHENISLGGSPRARLIHPA